MSVVEGKSTVFLERIERIERMKRIELDTVYRRVDQGTREQSVCLCVSVCVCVCCLYASETPRLSFSLFLFALARLQQNKNDERGKKGESKRHGGRKGYFLVTCQCHWPWPHSASTQYIKRTQHTASRLFGEEVKVESQENPSQHLIPLQTVGREG